MDEKILRGTMVMHYITAIMRNNVITDPLQQLRMIITILDISGWLSPDESAKQIKSQDNLEQK